MDLVQGSTDLSDNPSSEIRQVTVQYCPENSNPALRWIKDAADFQLLQQNPNVISPSDADNMAAAIPVDFSRHYGLLVQIGSKPTPGYSLKLNRSASSMASGQVSVTIDISQPPEDAVLAQVITYPCTLILLPKSGYSRVEVNIQDNKNTTQLETTIP